MRKITSDFGENLEIGRNILSPNQENKSSNNGKLNESNNLFSNFQFGHQQSPILNSDSQKHTALKGFEKNRIEKQMFENTKNVSFNIEKKSNGEKEEDKEQKLLPLLKTNSILRYENSNSSNREK